MNSCPFCPLERRSPWYLETADGIKVVQDLKNKGYKYRILVVGSGEKWHRPIEQYSQKEVDRLLSFGKAVAQQHIKKGWAAKVAEVDKKHLKYPGHWHAQFCMV